MKIFSVSEITRELKLVLEERWSEVWIEGEISNFRPASSGHFYFSLKDETTQIRAVMFRGAGAKLRFRPENGLSVLGHGRLSVYEPRGEYQIILEHMEPKGIGALQLAFEQLKKKLESEGLFDPARKRKIPFLPRKICLITSPTGSVVRDMIHVLTRRFPDIEILLSPVSVQGDSAGADIARAIEEVNQREDVDLLIVGRGGGSMEDLWAFNEEVVARAIAASRIPVISAVGHETDFTIADFVADLRAPTPSVAAELAVPVKEDLLYTLQEMRHRLYQSIDQKIENGSLLLRQWEGFFRDPGRRLTEYLLRMDHYREQLQSLMLHHLEMREENVKSFSQKLQALSPLAILQRGYAIATHGDVDGKQKPLRNAQDVNEGDSVHITLSKGSLLTRVQKVGRG